MGLLHNWHYACDLSNVVGRSIFVKRLILLTDLKGFENISCHTVCMAKSNAKTPIIALVAVGHCYQMTHSYHLMTVSSTNERYCTLREEEYISLLRIFLFFVFFSLFFNEAWSMFGRFS